MPNDVGGCRRRIHGRGKSGGGRTRVERGRAGSAQVRLGRMMHRHAETAGRNTEFVEAINQNILVD